MPATSENEAQNFEVKARRGQEVLDLLISLGKKEILNESDKQEIENLRNELNEINEWFQKTSK